PNKLAVDALHIGCRDTVLELGFGPGHAIEMMASRAPAGTICGVDQSPIMLEQAERRNQVAIQEERVFLYRTAFDTPPFEKASFDKILAVNVIYFWRDAAAVVKEIRRVLSPGGRVSIYAREATTMRRWKFANSETHHLYEADALNEILHEAGFDSHRIFVRNIHVVGRVRGLLATISGSGKPMRLRTNG
ncbi:MAG: Methyltransferase type 11, partial [Rhodospirillales bacterium]|nr:Methyltransferase type 11 [Rhodospirillales bacterium]